MNCNGALRRDPDVAVNASGIAIVSTDPAPSESSRGSSRFTRIDGFWVGSAREGGGSESVKGGASSTAVDVTAGASAPDSAMRLRPLNHQLGVRKALSRAILSKCRFPWTTSNSAGECLLPLAILDLVVPRRRRRARPIKPPPLPAAEGAEIYGLP